MLEHICCTNIDKDEDGHISSEELDQFLGMGLSKALCDDFTEKFRQLAKDDSGKNVFGGYIREKMVQEVKSNVRDGKYSALEAKSKAAVWGTGDVVLASGSSDGRETKNEFFIKCEGDAKTCLDVVDRAVKLEQTVADRVQKRYGSSKVPLQREINKLINGKPETLFKRFWKDSAFSFEPKEWIEWVDRLIMDAEQQLYELSDAQVKQLVGSDQLAQIAAPAPKMVEKDEDLEEEVIKAKGKKWEGKEVPDDDHSDAWKQLSTSQVYAKLSQEEADSRWEGWFQGKPGFNEHARKLMRRDDVPRAKTVTAPTSAQPSVQPYQETVSWLIHPKSIPNPRMLVVHRTGAGTLSSPLPTRPRAFSWQICACCVSQVKLARLSAFVITSSRTNVPRSRSSRPRPSAPTFTRSLSIRSFQTGTQCTALLIRQPCTPTDPPPVFWVCRFAEYLQREGLTGDVRKGLELTNGVLRSGRVRPEYLHSEYRPSAPLRAFSYTQAGGQQSCGTRSAINAVFKCPDGYAGGWNFGPGEKQETDGYGEDEFEWDGNPLCALQLA